MESYKKARDLDPKCGPAHSNLAVALVGEDEFEEAGEHYEKALQVNPNAETHNGLWFQRPHPLHGSERVTASWWTRYWICASASNRRTDQ